MEELLAEFRRGAGLRPRVAFHRDLRELACQYAREAAAHGVSLHRIAVTLGIHDKTLQRWLEGKSAPKSEALVREVRVVQEPRSTPVLVTPSGLRVEGLSIPEIVVLLEALR